MESWPKVGQSSWKISIGSPLCLGAFLVVVEVTANENSYGVTSFVKMVFMALVNVGLIHQKPPFNALSKNILVLIRLLVQVKANSLQVSPLCKHPFIVILQFRHYQPGILLLNYLKKNFFKFLLLSL